MTLEMITVQTRTTCALARRPSRAPKYPPMAAATSMVKLSGARTDPVAMNMSTATVRAALTNSVRGALKLFSVRASSSPHTAIIINPTAPPK
jgi:hypothetical protein